MPPIALQLWTIREALTQNPAAALARVRSIGFESVELAPLPPETSSAKMGAMLRTAGLSVTAIHCDAPTASNLHGLLRLVDDVSCRRLVWHGWTRDPLFDSVEGVRTLIDRWNMSQRLAEREGLTFGLHNHWWEFEPVDGVVPHELMRRTLDPAIFFEVDVYWAQTAGVNPVGLVRDLGPRCSMLHLKDGPAAHGQPMTALGTGTVDIAGVIGASRPGTTFVVELDEYAGDPFDAAEASWQFLQRNARAD